LSSFGRLRQKIHSVGTADMLFRRMYGLPFRDSKGPLHFVSGLQCGGLQQAWNEEIVGQQQFLLYIQKPEDPEDIVMNLARGTG
jgi:hypothetical protein